MPNTPRQNASRPQNGEAILYCLVPADRPKLHELLDRHFRNFSEIRVVAERRGLDRRSGEDRRHGAASRPRDAERRRTNPEPERRAKRRRAQVELVKAPVELPPEARRYADEIVFARRVA